MSLSQLPAEDIELILTAEDEVRRCGHWQCVLPCRDMGTRYLPYFEFPRYRNTVCSARVEGLTHGLTRRMHVRD